MPKKILEVETVAWNDPKSTLSFARQIEGSTHPGELVVLVGVSYVGDTAPRKHIAIDIEGIAFDDPDDRKTLERILERIFHAACEMDGHT